MRTLKITAIALLAASGFSSCMTTYDAAGRPVQTVDPGAAAVGVAAAGILGYAAGRNNSRKNYYYTAPYYGGGYGGGYYGGGYGHGHGGYYRY